MPGRWRPVQAMVACAPAAIFLLLFLLFGCKTFAPSEGRVSSQRGCIPGGCLATVHAIDDDATVKALCNQVDHVIACARVIPIGEHGVRGAVLTFPFPPGWAPTQIAVDVAAHELCHAVAKLQKLDRDPCHDEDGGVIHR